MMLRVCVPNSVTNLFRKSRGHCNGCFPLEQFPVWRANSAVDSPPPEALIDRPSLRAPTLVSVNAC